MQWHNVEYMVYSGGGGAGDDDERYRTNTATYSLHKKCNIKWNERSHCEL